MPNIDPTLTPRQFAQLHQVPAERNSVRQLSRTTTFRLTLVVCLASLVTSGCSALFALLGHKRAESREYKDNEIVDRRTLASERSAGRIKLSSVGPEGISGSPDTSVGQRAVHA
jgi:hypothetical protein